MSWNEKTYRRTCKVVRRARWEGGRDVSELLVGFAVGWMVVRVLRMVVRRCRGVGRF